MDFYNVAFFIVGNINTSNIIHMDAVSLAPDIDFDESFDGNDFSVEFTPEILQILDSVLPSEDPLDRPDFDIVAYINQIFPSEQSLANVDNVVAEVRQKIQLVT